MFVFTFSRHWLLTNADSTDNWIESLVAASRFCHCKWQLMTAAAMALMKRPISPISAQLMQWSAWVQTACLPTTSQRQQVVFLLVMCRSPFVLVLEWWRISWPWLKTVPNSVIWIIQPLKIIIWYYIISIHWTTNNYQWPSISIHDPVFMSRLASSAAPFHSMCSWLDLMAGARRSTLPHRGTLQIWVCLKMPYSPRTSFI